MTNRRLSSLYYMLRSVSNSTDPEAALRLKSERLLKEAIERASVAAREEVDEKRAPVLFLSAKDHEGQTLDPAKLKGAAQKVFEDLSAVNENLKVTLEWVHQPHSPFPYKAIVLDWSQSDDHESLLDQKPSNNHFAAGDDFDCWTQ